MTSGRNLKSSQRPALSNKAFVTSIDLESISQPQPREFETPVDRADREVVIEISAESQMGIGAAVLNHEGCFFVREIDTSKGSEFVPLGDPHCTHIRSGCDSEEFVIRQSLADGREVAPRLDVFPIDREIIEAGAEEDGGTPSIRVFTDQTIGRVEADLIDQRAIVKAHSQITCQPVAEAGELLARI